MLEIRNKRMQQKSTFKKISIDKPCTENWDKMQSQGANKFCQQCSKTVVDFSKMSDKEVLDFLEQKKNQRTCGKFEPQQLQQINRQLLQNQPNTNFLIPILTAAFLTTVTLSATAQECDKPVSAYKIIKHQINSDSAETVVIRGKLMDNLYVPLTNATIQIQEISTVTDSIGNFELSFEANKYDDFKVIASYYNRGDFEFSLAEIQNKEIEITLQIRKEIIVGGVSYIPWHKRIWYKITSVFR